MFVEFRHRIPGLSAWMEYCYSGQPLLHLGKHTIHSCCGVQQGDPLGPLGFALTLHPLIEIIKSSLPSSLAMNAWYLDDGTLVGSPESLSAALGIIEKEGPKLGLHLNRRKSLLFIPKECDASSSPLPSDVPVAQGGFTLLGCPIGPPSYCEDILRARIDKIKQSLAALHELRDAQCETALLRSCLALPKLSYIIRTCPPCHISEGCKEFDSIIRDSLEMILGGPVSEWSLLKATLPSSRGGINLRSASLHAPAAFVASSISSQQLVGDILDDLTIHLHHLNSALSALASSTMKSDWEDLEAIDVPLHQRHLSAAIDEVNHQHLLSSAPTTRACALANSTSLPHAGDWLNGVPSVSLGLHLHDREFRCCLRYWLGVPMHSTPYPCPQCHCTADVFGDHQVGCGGNSDRISRHNALRDVLFTAAQSGALAPCREASGVIPDSLRRPADILLPNWHQGQSAALDVHIISPLQQLTLSEAAYTPGHALEVGVRRKVAANPPSCRSAGVDFIPIVAETLNWWAGRGHHFHHLYIGHGHNSASWPNYRRRLHKTTIQQVCSHTMRGNATLWMHRLPPVHPSVDGVI